MLTLLGVCVLATLANGQQIGLKTNLLMDATRTVNLGVEIGLSKKFTLEVTGNYNPWEYGNNKQFKMLMAQPELRYWFCDRLNGHFVGLHLHGGIYNAVGIKMPFGVWKELEDHRFKGHFYGAGISYGYQWILGKHWNLEASVGVGYARAKYEKYTCETCVTKAGEGYKNYVGPTKAVLGLIYVF